MVIIDANREAEISSIINEADTKAKMSTPLSNSGAAGSSNFFPSSQTTPDHSSANALLAARKQQLAHLQTLQRQQQQVLQQMSARGGGSSLVVGFDGRDDRFSAGGLRSHPTSPVGSAVGASSVVSFAAGTAYRSPSSPRPSFECDYDSNPTELYLRIQKKEWDSAIERAVSCPAEASTWVSRKEADGKLRWRLLPLHAAIIFKAPERTVSALLLAFGQGAACKDDQGMLPLHLAFRNGSEEDVVQLLLMAYPQSVDVQDRKGRVPMVLAQQSTSPHRDAYVRALERGPAYYAVANAAKDGLVGAPSPGAGALVNYGFPSMPPTMPAGLPEMNFAAAPAASGRDTSELEAELAKTQETSQVLVDHVNSLEAQLASRSDTERFLATKIANLDSQLKEANAKLATAAEEMTAKEGELAKKDEEADEKVAVVRAEVEKLEIALADKKAAELKSYKLTNRERYDLEEKVETLEKDCAAATANAAVLEAQLKKKIETEQSLASQVSMLASQLASSATSSSEATSAYERKCELLTEENKKLQSHVDKLEGKLDTVASALDAMAAEQERIVEAATKHERTMDACASANRTIVEDTTRQETLLEDAAKEREQIVSILMRQAEDAERTMADREKVLESVKRQEADIAEAARERDAVVDSVNKQREYMDFMLNGELQFLKRTESEDKCDLVKEGKAEEMEARKAEFLNKDEEAEEEPAVVEDDAEAEEEADAADEDEDEESDSDEEEEDDDSAALEEAAKAVKAAMQAAEGVVERDTEDGYETPDEEEEEEEDDEDDAVSASRED